MNIFKIVILSLYVLAIMVEIVWSIKKNKKVYSANDSIANFLIVIGGRLTRPIALAWGYLLFNLVLPFQVFNIENNIYTVIIAFFLVEFVYYWYHRLSHERPLLWSFHQTHHSSLWYNLTTAGRINWLGKFLAVFFYVPLVIVGFSPELITFLLAFSLVYQIILHTQMIGKLRFLEGLFFNTPSAHRVHHASNKRFLNKNYGGATILFDKLFGTYASEDEKVKYGVTTGFVGNNPFVIQFMPLIILIRKRIRGVFANKMN